MRRAVPALSLKGCLRRLPAVQRAGGSPPRHCPKGAVAGNRRAARWRLGRPDAPGAAAFRSPDVSGGRAAHGPGDEGALGRQHPAVFSRISMRRVRRPAVGALQAAPTGSRRARAVRYDPGPVLGQRAHHLPGRGHTAASVTPASLSNAVTLPGAQAPSADPLADLLDCGCSLGGPRCDHLVVPVALRPRRTRAARAGLAVAPPGVGRTARGGRPRWP